MATPACACGAPVAASEAGTVACACGRGVVVRAADARALAIDVTARWVVEPLPRVVSECTEGGSHGSGARQPGGVPITPQATFGCAACGAEQRLGPDPRRVRRCGACQVLTYVDDPTHAQSFDPPRRPTFYLILGGA